jgi:hypothetical protein
MDPTFKAICFTVAFVIFVLTALLPQKPGPVNYVLNVALGLAFFTFPFVWDAWELA